MDQLASGGHAAAALLLHAVAAEHLARLPAPLPVHLPRPAQAAEGPAVGAQQRGRQRAQRARRAGGASRTNGGRRRRRASWSARLARPRGSATPSSRPTWRDRAREMVADTSRASTPPTSRSASSAPWPRGPPSSPSPAASTGSTGAATSWSWSTTRPAAGPSPRDDARSSLALAALRRRRVPGDAPPVPPGRAAPPADRRGRGLGAHRRVARPPSAPGRGDRGRGGRGRRGVQGLGRYGARQAAPTARPAQGTPR